MKKIKITYIYVAIIIVVAAAACLTFVCMRQALLSFDDLRDHIDVYNSFHDAFDEMTDASAYLTDQSRYYVVRGDREHLDNYITEVNVTRRREHALSVINDTDEGSELYESLENALARSNDLAEIEIYAMMLAADAREDDISDSGIYDFGIALYNEDLALSAEQKLDKARDMVFDDNYFAMKEAISESVYTGIAELVDDSLIRTELDTALTESRLSRANIYIIILILTTVIMAAASVIFLVVPLRRIIDRIHADEKLDEHGSAEVAYLAQAYNALHEERKKNISRLSYEASHDALTGIYNRGVFEDMTEGDMEEDSAMMLVDVDVFKGINDTYGHETGDLVLQKVAAALSDSFRSNDYVFRIGGDEFAVILINMKREYKDVLKEKIRHVRESLSAAEDIPDVTLSIGVAFNDSEDDHLTLFKKADTALYVSKDGGRARTTFYKEETIQ